MVESPALVRGGFMSEDLNINTKYYKTEDVFLFFKMMKKMDISYVLIKNIGGELPDKLPCGKDMDILVHPKDYERYKRLMPQFGYKEIPHPYGTESGWNFLYGMDASVMFEHRINGLQVDTSTKLSTKSLNMNAWIPLDMEIQNSIWRDRVSSTLWYEMDKVNLSVYLVTRAVFEKNGFSDAYKREIEELKYLYEKETVKNKFEKIFFRFTPHLIHLIKTGSYDKIIDSYISFVDY